MRYQQTGIYLVRLSGMNRDNEKVDHVVAYEAGRQVVLDCVERFALRISSWIFDVCVGDDLQFLGISEMRLLYAQDVGERVTSGKNKKPNKRISYNLKLERRKEKKGNEDKFTNKKSKTKWVMIDDEEWSVHLGNPF